MAKRILVLTLIASAIAFKSFAYEATQREEKTFRMKSGGHITIIGDEGYIRIKSWDKEEVSLRMTKRAWERSRARAEARLEEIEVEIEHDADHLFIRQVDRDERKGFSFWDIFDPDRWREGWRDVQVDFDLTVPRRINLKIENDEGEVEIADVQGDLRINVDEGRVNLEKIASDNIRIEVDEGDVTCYQVKEVKDGRGRLYVDSDEGRVRIEGGSFSRLHIYCDEGDVILSQVRSREGNYRTDEGDIEADIDILKNGKYRLMTDEGDIFIILPKDVDVRIHLETEEGYIRTDFPLSIKKWEEGQRAEGTIGKGTARLNAYTDEGDIFLEEK